MPATDPYPALKAATIAHRREHGCHAYTFEDGAGLAAISAALRPVRMLELGAALGYTACCLASGCELGRVDTIERDPVHVAIARRHIAQAGLADRVTVHEGDFEDVLSKLDGSYDLIFFDGLAPTHQMIRDLQNRLKPNGVFVCANLGLCPPAETRRIVTMFGSRSEWRALASIEGGATYAWVKAQSR